MEYTIGSLSDLITGGNTPNKKKVIKQQFIVDVKPEKEENETPEKVSKNKRKKLRLKNIVATNSNENSVDAEASSDINTNKKKWLKSKKPRHDNNEEDNQNSAEAEEISDSNTKKQAKSRKRKHDDNEDSSVEKKKPKQEAPDPEKEARTIFVGNVPLVAKKSALKKLFSKYGNIDAVRYRGLPTTDPKVPKKVAFIKQEFHKDRASCIAYVRFDNAESAEKALEANGVLFEGHHLKVNMSRTDKRPDESKAIFLGNITFNAEEEDLWKLFEPCGTIESVRLVRDKRSGMGKGFGYINFKSSDAVHLALEMGEVNYKGRPLRISMCNLNAAKRNKRLNKAKPIKKAGIPRRPFNKDRKQKQDKEQGDVRKPKRADAPASNSFQGSKFTEKKKKNKPNKGALKKKAMMKKITPKSKTRESQE